MKIESDRERAIEFCTRYGAFQAASILRSAGRDDCALQAAKQELGSDRFVDVLFEEKNVRWTFCALITIPDLSIDQRSKLINSFQAKDLRWAYAALRAVRDLTVDQRSKLERVAGESV